MSWLWPKLNSFMLNDVGRAFFIAFLLVLLRWSGSSGEANSLSRARVFALSARFSPFPSLIRVLRGFSFIHVLSHCSSLLMHRASIQNCTSKLETFKFYHFRRQTWTFYNENGQDSCFQLGLARSTSSVALCQITIKGVFKPSATVETFLKSFSVQDYLKSKKTMGKKSSLTFPKWVLGFYRVAGARHAYFAWHMDRHSRPYGYWIELLSRDPHHDNPPQDMMLHDFDRIWSPRGLKYKISFIIVMSTIRLSSKGTQSKVYIRIVYAWNSPKFRPYPTWLEDVWKLSDMVHWRMDDKVEQREVYILD